MKNTKDDTKHETSPIITVSREEREARIKAIMAIPKIDRSAAQHIELSKEYARIAAEEMECE